MGGGVSSTTDLLSEVNQLSDDRDRMSIPELRGRDSRNSGQFGEFTKASSRSAGRRATSPGPGPPGRMQRRKSLMAPSTDGPLSEAQQDLRYLIAKYAPKDAELGRVLEKISHNVGRGKVSTETVDLVRRAQRQSQGGDVTEWVMATLQDESTNSALDEVDHRDEDRIRLSGQRRSSSRGVAGAVDKGYLRALSAALMQSERGMSADDLEEELVAAAASVSAADAPGSKKTHQDKAVARLSQGSILLRLGRHAEALEDFERAISCNGGCVAADSAVAAAAWHKKGEALAYAKDFKSATAAHMTAMSLAPAKVQTMGVTDFLALMLEASEDWDRFDVVGLDAASLGKPISALAAHVLGLGQRSQSDGLLARISVGERVQDSQRGALAQYCLVLDAEYSGKQLGRRKRLPAVTRLLDSAHFNFGPVENAGNAYHNRLHGCDVMQATHLLSMQDRCFSSLDDAANVALLFAAMVHDFRHPGLNNAYLVKTHHLLALRYSDDSVLERMHLAEAFDVLAKPDHDWLHVDAHTRRRIRALVVNSVLATDLAQSGRNIATFAGHVHADSDFSTDVNAQRALHAIILKAADVSHPARARRTHVFWTKRILVEFFEQGDLEKELDQPVSPLCDRHKFDLGPAQTGFIDFVTRPIFAALDEFCAGGTPVSTGGQQQHHEVHLTAALANLEANSRYWKEDSVAVWKEWACEFTSGKFAASESLARANASKAAFANGVSPRVHNLAKPAPKQESTGAALAAFEALARAADPDSSTEVALAEECKDDCAHRASLP
ncbi:hypothetical protein M885DRAFT_479740 [Pelagophyceae sp. CCMP2097]|nr:hypothetical protein M885DRAFT_479740 [Pelagophyceae sp. CCMP2097]